MILGLLLCPWITLSSSPLTFDDAVSNTLRLSPSLRIADSLVDASEGEQLNSSFYPNPVFAYSVENVFGNKDWRGWKSAESRYELEQLVELGGKRGYRFQSATYQHYAAQAGYEAKQIALLNRLLKLFAVAASAQEIYLVAQEQIQLAEESLNTVKAKVDSGKVSLIQQNKAQIAFLNSQMHLVKAQSKFEQSKLALSMMWGCTCPEFDTVAFSFYDIQIPKPYNTCVEELECNPELTRSYMEQLAAQENLSLERAKAIPDVVFTLGYKTLQDTHHRGLILGAAIPLPIFNRNQGNIQKAKAENLRTQENYAQINQLLKTKLSIAHQRLQLAYFEADTIRSTVLKTSVESYDLAKDGYEEGKFEYLDLLDSQNTLFDVRVRYIEALEKYHQSVADIEYINTEDNDL